MVTPANTPFPFTAPDELWQITLAELRLQMTKATFNAWLADSSVLTSVSDFNRLVIVVRNQYAQAWLTHRLSPIIARTLTYITGREIEFCFVYKHYAKKAVVRSLAEKWDTSLRGDRQTLTRSSYIPQSTPNLKGETAMTNQSHPPRVRIYSHLTQSRFLHVEDALAMGKLRLFAGNYRQGHGMNSYAHAYIDVADARVIFAALARGEQGFRHKEYKGTPPRQNRAAISRVLSVVVKGASVYMELKSGPGKMTNTGAILPNGRSTIAVNVGFKLYEARRMAASVLAYIHAWDLMRMMVKQQVVSQPMPYLLVSAARAANEVQSVSANNTPKPNRADGAPVPVANGRPITRRGSVSQANGAMVKPDTVTPPTQPLQYGDGRWVDRQNLIEVQTFHRYVAEMKAAPKSKIVLLAYYQQEVEAKVHVVSQ